MTTEVKSNNAKANRWLERILASNHVLWMIFVLSMLESIIIPVPLELVLIPLLIHERKRWFAIATATLAGCLVGATIGYSVGMFLFDTAGQWVLAFFGYEQAFENFQQEFSENGFITLLLVGITPIPFQVGMLTAGSTDYPYLLFMLASLIARGIRYYGLALLVNWLGERILHWWENYQTRLGIGALLAGIAIFLLVVLV
ncbi:YqaA family protein [Pseudidiomarina sediminum]|uniref:YqaA family protein n=1 Tax=Pseudidiomarina sediminum TaxID=431675 RepID=UPI001C93D829|nr:VTT domain-containing protein [Pseudidiomarina sediminum]MBY6063012.1 VTT domain-containing protein [Pseudidiomarina sediminum]